MINNKVQYNKVEVTKMHVLAYLIITVSFIYLYYAITVFNRNLVSPTNKNNKVIKRKNDDDIGDCEDDEFYEECKEVPCVEREFIIMINHISIFNYELLGFLFLFITGFYFLSIIPMLLYIAISSFIMVIYITIFIFTMYIILKTTIQNIKKSVEEIKQTFIFFIYINLFFKFQMKIFLSIKTFFTKIKLQRYYKKIYKNKKL